METIFDILPYFLLMLIRLTSFFLIAPIFSMRGVPTQFKIGIAAFLAFVAVSTLPMGDTIPLDSSYILLIIKELGTGLALGFTAALLLYAVQIAGAFIDFQMGFSMANVLDPQTGAQVPIIGHFKYMMALLFLLTANGHHLMLDGVMQSLRVFPVERLAMSVKAEDIAMFMTGLFTEMFLIALQIALPIVGALFLVDVALGILAKTVPQLNIFAVGLPLKIFVGFIMLFLTMPVFFFILQILFEKILVSMAELIGLLGGR
ncbi:flagellar biosynthesis protein FliR [Planococcus antarcticus DSM 14505]|uniref:Flagellar biosynthetic protein FliR n=1 Tax=Planococcus antarcticus DSM 14505 TaxID=1185653 RepID=A0A1C7DD16_9BACL|nr:flagellar biosynthetic protein FliR [Planococcus antarcticus]ANU09163.1 flagellar biosynthetic protein FliR [Planococcus antarcticus DSM 14505]EIM08496.1 flagellar biosynthesis protein FliR [Planococcus antarcticus DSM 14505]